MNNNVAVLVTQCTKDGSRIYGERLFNKTFATLDQARETGEGKREDGMSVVVRPDYNEQDERGRFFREWRSFNGEDFKEVRWDL